MRSSVPMAAARFVAQGDGEEAPVVVGDALHLVEQHRDGFFQRRVVRCRDRQAVARAIGIEPLRLVGVQANLLDQPLGLGQARSEEHTSELQSLMRISYAVFCLKKKNT